MIPQFLRVSCDVDQGDPMDIIFGTLVKLQNSYIGILRSFCHGTFAVVRLKLRNLSFSPLLEPETLP